MYNFTSDVLLRCYNLVHLVKHIHNTFPRAVASHKIVPGGLKTDRRALPGALGKFKDP